MSAAGYANEEAYEVNREEDGGVRFRLAEVLTSRVAPAGHAIGRALSQMST